MEQIFIYIVLIVSGAIFGSFAGAQVWRLRARQLVEDKKNKEKVDSSEYKRLLPLTKKKNRNHSIDIDTGKRLSWYDMVPIFSWLFLRGKSRFSGKPIGYFELLIEILMPLFFALSYALWPYDLSIGSPLAIAQFVLWLAAGVGLAVLFVYDLKWSLLPDRAVVITMVIAAISALLVVIQSSAYGASLLSLGGAILVLSGIYGVLFLVSRGQWIGFGDVKLGLILALLLADWSLAIVAFFAANFVGCLIVLPGMITGKIKPKTRIPFGPLLIIGMLIAQFFGYDLVNWYTAGLLIY